MTLTLCAFAHNIMHMGIDLFTLYEKIGEQLKQRRIELGFTQDFVADEVGVSRTSITNIEAGSQKLPLHLLYRICLILDLEPSNLLPALIDVQYADSDKREDEGKTASFIQGAFKDLEDD